MKDHQQINDEFYLPKIVVGFKSSYSEKCNNTMKHKNNKYSWRIFCFVSIYFIDASTHIIKVLKYMHLHTFGMWLFNNIFFK